MHPVLDAQVVVTIFRLLCEREKKTFEAKP